MEYPCGFIIYVLGHTNKILLSYHLLNKKIKCEFKKLDFKIENENKSIKIIIKFDIYINENILFYPKYYLHLALLFVFFIF